MITTNNNSRKIHNSTALQTHLIQAKRQVLGANTSQQRFRWRLIQAIIEGTIASTQVNVNTNHLKKVA